MTNDAQIAPSSGNVFADLNIDKSDELLAKAELAIRICEEIARRRLSHVRAASILGLGEPRILALMHGRLEGFSTERLFRFLNALDLDVESSSARRARGAPAPAFTWRRACAPRRREVPAA